MTTPASIDHEDQTSALAELKSKLDMLAGQLANADNRVENQSALVTNSYLNVEKILAELTALDAKVTQIKSSIEMSSTDEIPLRLAALETAALTSNKTKSKGKFPPKGKAQSVHWADLLKTSYPGIFQTWYDLYEVGMASYNESVEASCSTWENRFAVAFRDYVSIFASGYLLDIGSGTLKRPVYLEGYPAELLRGLDPRKVDAPADFEISCGVNEFIPWEDGSFQTAVNATSLDHVIDLDRSLQETARILAPSGKFILWYADLPDAALPPCVTGPESEKVAGIDAFHLFHLNDKWFLEKLEKHFSLIDRRIFSVGGFSHVFAVYEKR